MEYSQNATHIFMSAYVIYVLIGKITIPLSTHLYQQRYLFWLRRQDLLFCGKATAVAACHRHPAKSRLSNLPITNNKKEARPDRANFIFMVAEAGFEPTTFGLSLRALCGGRKNPRAFAFPRFFRPRQPLLPRCIVRGTRSATRPNEQRSSAS